MPLFWDVNMELFSIVFRETISLPRLSTEHCLPNGDNIYGLSSESYYWKLLIDNEEKSQLDEARPHS